MTCFVASLLIPVAKATDYPPPPGPYQANNFAEETFVIPQAADEHAGFRGSNEPLIRRDEPLASPSYPAPVYDTYRESQTYTPEYITPSMPSAPVMPYSDYGYGYGYAPQAPYPGRESESKGPSFSFNPADFARSVFPGLVEESSRYPYEDPYAPYGYAQPGQNPYGSYYYANPMPTTPYSGDYSTPGLASPYATTPYGTGIYNQPPVQPSYQTPVGKQPSSKKPERPYSGRNKAVGGTIFRPPEDVGTP